MNDTKMAMIISYLMDQLNLTELTITAPMIDSLLEKHGEDANLNIKTDLENKAIHVSIIKEDL